MSWMERYVRPRIRGLLRPEAVPESAAAPRCPHCARPQDPAELERLLRLCPHCGYHLRLTAPDRLRLTLDGGYKRIDLPKAAPDPLGFRDGKRYTDRLRDARAKTGLEDALLAATGHIMRQPATVAAMDFNFMGGSMGAAVGHGLLAAAEAAIAATSPLVVFTASGGARMQEGTISLMQMPRSILALRRMRDARLPTIIVFTHPTTGGVTASFAMLGDVHLAEPGALIGFAGARVIEQTVRETLPEGFQRAEYLHEHGLVDAIVPRPDLRATLARLIALMTRAPPEDAHAEEEPLTW